MAFLTLNGIAVPMVSSGGTKRVVDLGGYARSYNGTPYSTVRARKMEVSGTTIPLSQPLSEAFEYLFEGRGHSWGFEFTLTSSRGLEPSTTNSQFEVDGSPYFGEAALRLYAQSGFVRWRVWEDAWDWSTWTLMYWMLDPQTGAWHHYVRTSSGLWWRDGAPSTSQSHVLGFIGYGWLNIGPDAFDIVVDDLVALPYVVPSDWPAQVYSANAPFGPLPKHTVGGTWLAGRCSKGLVRWESTDPVNGLGGTMGAQVSFQLYGD